MDQFHDDKKNMRDSMGQQNGYSPEAFGKLCQAVDDLCDAVYNIRDTINNFMGTKQCDAHQARIDSLYRMFELSEGSIARNLEDIKKDIDKVAELTAKRFRITMVTLVGVVVTMAGWLIMHLQK